MSTFKSDLSLSMGFIECPLALVLWKLVNGKFAFKLSTTFMILQTGHIIPQPTLCPKESQPFSTFLLRLTLCQPKQFTFPPLCAFQLRYAPLGFQRPALHAALQGFMRWQNNVLCHQDPSCCCPMSCWLFWEGSRVYWAKVEEIAEPYPKTSVLWLQTTGQQRGCSHSC